jgi:hypothetical protein
MSAGKYTLYYDSDPHRRNDLCKEAYELHRNLMRQENHSDSVYAIDLAENADALAKYRHKLMPLMVHNAGSEIWEGETALDCLCQLFGVRRAMVANGGSPVAKQPPPPGALLELPPPSVTTTPPPTSPALVGSNTGLRPLPKAGDDSMSSILSLPLASNAVEALAPPPPLPPSLMGSDDLPPPSHPPIANEPHVAPEFVLYYEDNRSHYTIPSNGLVKLVNLKLMRSIMDTSLLHNYLQHPHALPMLVTLDESRPTIWYGAAATWQCRLLAAVNGGPNTCPPVPHAGAAPDFVLYVDDMTAPATQTIIVPESGQVHVRRLTAAVAKQRAYLRDAPNTPVLVTNERRPTVWHGKAARSYCHMLSALCGGGIYVGALAAQPLN